MSCCREGLEKGRGGRVHLHLCHGWASGLGGRQAVGREVGSGERLRQIVYFRETLTKDTNRARGKEEAICHCQIK